MTRVVTSVTILFIILLTTLSIVKLPDINSTALIDNRDGFTYADKVIHICFYFVLNFLMLLLFEVRYTIRQPIVVFIISASVVLYGCLIEVVQYYVGRECSIYDVIANSIGVILAVIVFLTIYKKSIR